MTPMSCTRIHDFVEGTTITLAAPPCRPRPVVAVPEGERHNLNLLHPSAAALAIIERQRRLLMRRRKHKAA
ncbi:MAG: hypothetical protein HY057_06785 [Rhodospirillales bacterium]|nr:hypothetical protein [Rhodospirillales bacterium]